MDTTRNSQHEPGRENAVNRNPQNTDLPDSPHDAERLRGDEATLDLPDVKDIPGQEFVHTAPLGMLSDTTISSDDEEGAGIFGEEGGGDDDEAIPGTEPTGINA